MMYKKMTLGAMLATALIMTSCEKKQNNDPEITTPGGKGKFLVETTILNSDASNGSTYIQLIPSLSGTVDNSNGIQVDFATSISIIGNDIFTFPAFGKDAINEIRKHTYDPASQTLKETGKLKVPPSTPNNMISVNSEKAYVPVYTLGKVWIINPKTMQKTGEIDLTSYAHGDNNPEPSNGVIRDGRLYLGLDQLDARWQVYENYRQVDVAVINIETNQVEKIISETASRLSFPARPLFKDMVFMNEQNDIYFPCVGNFASTPDYLQNGFVCIPAGKTEFDTSKSWDISGVDIQGSEYRSSALTNCMYIGNGKVAAYVTVAELNTNNARTAKNSMAVIIDLKAKTIKRVKGIPFSGPHGIGIGKYNNLVVFGADGADKVGYFTYDPATDKTNQVLNTKGTPFFFHAFE